MLLLRSAKHTISEPSLFWLWVWALRQLFDHKDTAKMTAFFICSTGPRWQLRKHHIDVIAPRVWRQPRSFDEWFDRFFRTRPYHAFAFFGDHRMLDHRYSLYISCHAATTLFRHRVILYSTDWICTWTSPIRGGWLVNEFCVELYLFSDHTYWLCKAREITLVFIRPSSIWTSVRLHLSADPPLQVVFQPSWWVFGWYWALRICRAIILRRCD
jgi:hypothetical protein